MTKDQQKYLIKRLHNISRYDVKCNKKEPASVKAARKKKAQAEQVLREWNDIANIAVNERLKKFNTEKEKILETIYFGDEPKALELLKAFEKEFKS